MVIAALLSRSKVYALRLLTVPEIVSAIQAQNTVNPAGKAGGEPAPKGQEFTYSVLAQGRLASPEEFGQIVVRETPDGGIVRVRAPTSMSWPAAS